MSNGPHGSRAKVAGREKRESTLAHVKEGFMKDMGAELRLPPKNEENYEETGDSGGRSQADGTVPVSLWRTVHGKAQTRVF